ncbi:MAG: DNA replication and repair protein RecF [Actinomycetia bacterium]|nr:DNA replication and repair protein RecF [Actinomycetes bacterium]
MIVSRLELTDFRNYTNATFEFHPGTTAVVGLNGQGKTNLAEALAYLASLDSFRGAPVEALIRVGSDTAIVRATVNHPDGRDVLVELEINRHGRNRAQVNGNKLGRARDLLGVMRVTVFSPDDLELVKGGPNDRRRFMDDTLVSTALKYDAMRLELDRIVKQRNTLLKQANGRLNADLETTLDVWDAKLADVGDQFGRARAELATRLLPIVSEAYEQLADRPSQIELCYAPQWREPGLAAALAAARANDVRRGVSTVGPHRDDVDLLIGGLPARTHASQGEQRTLALALRLAAHRLVAQLADSSPVLVLDDVLSELDPTRCAALLHHLPPGQVVLTTAGVLPDAAHPDATIRISRGGQVPES